MFLHKKRIMQPSNSKKVIFIGGTAYSGSTFLDMVLANAPDGFSCGEVNAYFYPYREHHINPLCGCGSPACDIWYKIKKNGLKKLYQTIFELYPEVNIIVDSSKDPDWIRDRIDDLKDTGISVENILIWKTPEEFFASCSKRGKTKRWEQEWINYHRYYFSQINNWISLPYKHLATTTDTLKKLCNVIDIPFFYGKEEYWRKKHHTLFGNTSAKIHLYDKKTDNYDQCQKNLTRSIKDKQPIKHKAVFYNSSGFPDEEIKLHSITKNIEKILYSTAMLRSESADSTTKDCIAKAKAGKMYILYQNLKKTYDKKRSNYIRKKTDHHQSPIR